MIAIADGGSTKCDWVILNDNGSVYRTAVTNGFNPNIIPPAQIREELGKSDVLSGLQYRLNQIYYYGSGCGTDRNCSLVEAEFQKFFPSSEVFIKDDLTAAAYAAFNGRPAIVCILGTGSNSCYFDGESVRRDLPSLGFLIGDEGGGSAIGKLLLRRFFMKKLPKDLEQEFQHVYNLSIEDALRNMYHNPRANAYLGEFNKFVADRKTHPYFQNMLFDEMKNFLDYHVLPYPEAREAEINFIGYVAFIYEDILRAAGAELNLRMGTVVRKPIESLVDYHRKYILEI